MTTDRDWIGLSDGQLAQYATQGYLHLRGVFSQAEIDLGLQIVDHAVAVETGTETIAHHPSYFNERSRRDLVRLRNAIAYEPELAYFLDHPQVVGAMVSVLGPWLQVLGTEAFYRDIDPVPHEPWHVDGGPPMYGVKIDHTGYSLQAKAQIFLTDVSRPHAGNFVLIPGSHKRPVPPFDGPEMTTLNDQLRDDAVSDEVVTVCAEPGDMLVFPYTLWHAVDRNVHAPRKSLILRFGHLWHRPHDYVMQPRDVLDRLSPRLRRMFADFGSEPHPMDYYKPTDQETVMSRGGDYTSLLARATAATGSV